VPANRCQIADRRIIAVPDKPIKLPRQRFIERRFIKRYMLVASLCNGMKQIPYREQRDTKNRTPQIEVMTNATLESPLHRRKQLKCFEDVSKYDDHKASRAD
jgi:hypothetical protein